ncbi:10619_t:CDS:2 [Funneliformis geosporum]|nr:10619_t:CDS:2 [Funneliformis geosporum]
MLCIIAHDGRNLIVKFWDDRKTQILQKDLQYFKVQNELNKELNLHANTIGNKRHELIKENHKRSFEDYEDDQNSQKRRSTNSCDEAIGPERLYNNRRGVLHLDHVLHPVIPVESSTSNDLVIDTKDEDVFNVMLRETYLKIRQNIHSCLSQRDITTSQDLFAIISSQI